MKPPHILICGEPGVGKSTLIERLLQHTQRKVYGFITERLTTGGGGIGEVYIHPANRKERQYTADNMVGTCGAFGATGNPAVFDSVGIALLKAPLEGVLLMDELGFMESEALVFCEKVLYALDGGTPVLAAVKTRQTPFLQEVRGHQNARLYQITPDNRDTLYDALIPEISAWNAY